LPAAPGVKIEDLGVWMDYGTLDQAERFWAFPDGRLAYSLWNPTVAARRTWARAGKMGRAEDISLGWQCFSIELTGINRKGTMVGNASADSGFGRGFVKNGEKVLWLEGPDDSYDQTIAHGISESGLVVGATISREGKWRGCVWKEGKATLLPVIEGIPVSGHSIDSHGVVMTLFRSPTGVERIYAVRDGKAVKPVAIGNWRQFSYLFSNDRGETAGDAAYSPKSEMWEPHNVVLIKEGRLHDLGRLPDSHMRVRGISPEGVIFGDARLMKEPGITLHAFTWDQKHGLRDLNGRLPRGSGWVLQEAHGVDANGAVFGIGLLNGQRRFYRLTLAN
jgi:hypothetical protein